MKRSVSTMIALSILIIVMFLGEKTFAVVTFPVSLLAMHELFGALHRMGIRVISFIGYIWCAVIPITLFTIINGLSISPGAGILAVFATICVIFVVYIYKFDRISVIDIAATLFAVIYIAGTFMCLGLIRIMPNGGMLIWIAFIGAWVTDSFAYLAGITFGNKRIVPEISPQKTVEGALGGWVGCMLVMNLFGVFAAKVFGTVTFSPLIFALLGLLCGLFSQIGDWAMSAIKRNAEIKDFGNIMPGHGGILDRFDSILFIAPLILAVLYLAVG